jgi:hypothetical protein
MFLEAIVCGLPMIAADTPWPRSSPRGLAGQNGAHVAVAGVVAHSMRQELRLLPGRQGVRALSAFCCRRSSIRGL